MKKVIIIIFVFITSFLFTFRINASEENGLKELKPSVGELVPSFNKNIFNYNIFLDEEKEQISFEASCLNDYKLEMNDTYKLKKGYNDINIICSKEDNITYKINVVRGENTQDEGLKSLTIKGYEIDFKTDKYNYEIDLKKEDESLVIDFETFNDKDTVTVSGNGAFNKGSNIVKVKVKGEKDVTYNIKVIKTEEVFKEIGASTDEISNSEQIVYIVLLIIICIAIIYFSFYLLFIRKKRTP